MAVTKRTTRYAEGPGFTPRTNPRTSACTDWDRLGHRSMNRLTLRDEKQIDDWIDELGGLTKHKEAARVYFLLHLIALGNDAGLL